MGAHPPLGSDAVVALPFLLLEACPQLAVNDSEVAAGGAGSGVGSRAASKDFEYVDCTVVAVTDPELLGSNGGDKEGVAPVLPQMAKA